MILAGGQSRRFGRAKAAEQLHGEPMILHVAERLARQCDEILVVVAELSQAQAFPMPPGARVVVDVHPGKGPLAGIYAGLRRASFPWALAVACDMPFLSPGLLAHMLALRSDWDAVVPVIQDRLQPTHAAYSQACLPVMHRCIERGSLVAARFFDEVRVKRVPEEDVRQFDPGLLSFFNINTPADLERALDVPAEGR